MKKIPKFKSEKEETDFKIGESAVSQASRRFQRIVEGDGTIRKKVKHLCNKLNLCNV